MGVPIRNGMELALEKKRESLKKEGIIIDILPVDSKALRGKQ